MRGHLREGRSWFERALALPAQEPQLRADALRGAAALAASQGDFARARADSEESVRLYRALGDSRGLARALSNLANTLSAGGEPAGAAGLYEESIALLEQAGDDWGVAVATLNRGFLALTLGDPERARALCEDSLSRFEAFGDREGMAHSVLTIGFASLSLDEPGDAFDRLAEGLRLARALGDTPDLADSLEGLAACHVAAGDALRAARLLGAAEALRSAVGGVRETSYDVIFDRTRAAVLEQLGETSTAATVAEGRGLPLDDAVQEALAFPLLQRRL